MRKRVKKADIIFLALLFAAVLMIAAFVYLRGGERGERVEVTVGGEVYGTYPLSENAEIPIVIDDITTNLLVISGGKADMTEADCPDKLCVHQKAVSKTNETIVCLPNKVVVQVIGTEESGFDTIAK